MKEKIHLQVLLPATQMLYEFRVPLDMNMHEAACLMSQILEAEEPILWEAQDDVDLMALEGEEAGRLLPRSASVRELVGCGALVDGCSIALS